MNNVSIEKNEYYISLLKNLYAGSHGEIISFLQIKFFKNLLCEKDELFFEQFLKVQDEDNSHLDKLAKCISSSGGVASYLSPKNMWISGNMIDYSLNMEKILFTMIQIKEKLVIDYKLAITNIKEKQINAVLVEIVKEEINHLAIFKNLLKKYQNN